VDAVQAPGRDPSVDLALVEPECEQLGKTDHAVLRDDLGD
jgi:hypothetical protein